MYCEAEYLGENVLDSRFLHCRLPTGQCSSRSDLYETSTILRVLRIGGMALSLDCVSGVCVMLESMAGCIPELILAVEKIDLEIKAESDVSWMR